MSFALWGVVFTLFPRFTNELAGVGYTGSQHAQDWTRIVGLFCLAVSVLLEGAHRSPACDVRRLVARSVLAISLPCAVLMTYWQIIPDRRWSRLDIVNIVLLYLVSYGMLRQSGLGRRRRRLGGGDSATESARRR